MGEGTRTWDKVCLGVLAVSALATPIVGALDAGRFRESLIAGLVSSGPALVCFVFGLALFTWRCWSTPFP